MNKHPLCSSACQQQPSPVYDTHMGFQTFQTYCHEVVSHLQRSRRHAQDKFSPLHIEIPTLANFYSRNVSEVPWLVPE